MLKKCFVLLALATSFLAAHGAASEEKNYLVAGISQRLRQETKGECFVVDFTNGTEVSSFYAYDDKTVGGLVYFENNETMQLLCRTTGTTLVIYNVDGSIFNQFSIDAQDELGISECQALLRNSNDDTLQLLCGYRSGKIILWDINKGNKVRTFDGDQYEKNSYGITAFSLYEDQGAIRVVATSCDKTVCIYDLSTGAKLKTLTGFAGWVTSVAVYKDETGFNIIAGAQDRTVRCWNAESGDERYVIDMEQYYTGPLDDQSAFVYGLVLLKMNNEQLLIAPIANSINIELFNAQSGSHVKTLSGNQGWVQDLRSYKCNDGLVKLVSGSYYDKAVRLFDVASGILENTFVCKAPIRNICLFGQSDAMCCASAQGDIGQTGEMFGALEAFNLETGTCLFSQDFNTWVNAVASYDQKFEDKMQFAVSHDSIKGCHIPIWWDLPNIPVISVSLV